MKFILLKEQVEDSGKIINLKGPREKLEIELVSEEVQDFIKTKTPNGYRLPKEMRDYIQDKELLKAWDSGWRGKLQYFCV